MNFISSAFVLFLTITFLLFVLAPVRWRKGLLLVASYLFYGTWSIPFIGLILLTTTTDYWFSQFIFKSQTQARRKLFLVLGLTVNLIILGYFKYANFFLETGFQLMNLLHLAPATASAPLLNILLPLGISFYTFEAISYLSDVYRGKEPARSFLDYNFYIMYFPHLISGPIIRFCELAPQYSQPLRLPTFKRLAQGLELILLGFAFKVLIADRVAPMADEVFAAAAHPDTLETYIGILAFTVQILFDFMGYTHIARGTSLLFNIELPLNFNYPYLASNISDFWQRWHISLSRWIRDYLYFPLGGSRATIVRTCSNLIVTMLIAGAWHGAGWTYIAWGGLHGLLLAGYHFYKHMRDHVLHLKPETIERQLAYRLLSWGLTFWAIITGWVFFRATDFKTAGILIQKLYSPWLLASDIIRNISTGHFTELVTLVSLLLCCVSGPWVINWIEKLYRPLPIWARVQVACLFLVLCWILTANSIQPFIYFQF